MEFGKNNRFNLIIDEFQEFTNINRSIYGDIQNIWDQYRHPVKLQHQDPATDHGGYVKNLFCTI